MYTNDPYEWPIYGMPSEYVLGDDAYTPDEYAEEMWKESSLSEVMMVSDHGRFYNTVTKRFLKPTHGDGHGHLAVKLSANGTHRQGYAHRLIAQAFIPNENNYSIVRHLDDDPSNNEIENLAWGTQKDNHADAVRNGTSYTLTNEDREKGLRITRKPVYAINRETGERTLYPGQCEAARILGLQQSNVFKALRGERSHSGGYRFEYAEKEDFDGGDD